MTTPSQKPTTQAIEIFVRLGLLLFIGFWCFQILSPFIQPVLWGMIIAVALYPLQVMLQKRLGGKSTLAAILLTLIMLSIVIVPVSMFVSSLTHSALILKSQIDSGMIDIHGPTESIQNIPLVGKKMFDILTLLTENTEQFIQQYQTEITEISKKVLNAIVGTGLGILQMLLSMVIAGVLLATKGTEKAAHTIMNKLIDDRGEEFVKIMTATIRNVVKGVLGVAVIQSILAGVGLYFAHIPHAGIWILVCLILSIVQVGPALVLIPSSIYLFTTGDTMTATLWSVYFAVVLTSDNILKPILLGKGAPVPMLVIFLGVIGGFLMSGFIGLFTGAIVLSIGYKLLTAWIGKPEETV